MSDQESRLEDYKRGDHDEPEYDYVCAHVCLRFPRRSDETYTAQEDACELLEDLYDDYKAIQEFHLEDD